MHWAQVRDVLILECYVEHSDGRWPVAGDSCSFATLGITGFATDVKAVVGPDDDVTLYMRLEGAVNHYGPKQQEPKQSPPVGARPKRLINLED